jgi:dCTP diphosphatase
MGNDEVIAKLRDFVAAREWEQFHTAANLAKSISIEAAELLECYQWDENADEALAKQELADVLTYAFLLADRLGEDPAKLILEKLELTEAKYPTELSRGKSTKYDRL